MSEEKTKRPTKLDEATALVRNRDTGGGEIVHQDVTGMLVPTNKAETEELLSSGRWEAAPQILSIEAGQTLTGLLEGNGPEVEFVNKETGIVNNVKTWILSRNGLRVSILSSAQLDRKLPPFVGGEVRICRGADKKHPGGIYTEYLVMGPRRPDGKPRDWATKPELVGTATPEDLLEVGINGVRA